jgi:hypothetical protein
MIFMAGLMMVANCALGPCVQVYTDPTTHQLIITANQNRPGTFIHPHPAPNHPYKPRPKPVAKPKPKPQTWIPYKAIPIVHRTYHYRAPKKKPSAIAKVVTTALTLSDQITRLLPGSKILYQPSKDSITAVPVYFWSDTNSVFQVATTILNVGVNVLMNPSFEWNFGDGTTFSTSSAGGPYPNSTITHTYKSPGTYTVNLMISWAGSWAAQGAVLPVLGGAIVQNATATIQVSPGPTDFTR